MIDFFVKEAINDEEASLLLQQVFSLAENKVVILSLQEIENLGKNFQNFANVSE